MDRLENYIQEIKGTKNIKLRGGALIPAETALLATNATKLKYFVFLKMITDASITSAVFDELFNHIDYLVPAPGARDPLSQIVDLLFADAANAAFRPLFTAGDKTPAKAWLFAQKLGPIEADALIISFIRYPIASDASPIKFRVGQQVTVNGSTLAGNATGAPNAIQNANKVHGIVEQVYQTDIDAFNFLETVRTNNFGLFQQLIEQISRKQLEKNTGILAIPAPAGRTAAINSIWAAINTTAIFAPIPALARVLGALGVYLHHFYRVSTPGGHLFPVFEDMALAALEAERIVDTYDGEPEIMFFKVTVYNIEKNNINNNRRLIGSVTTDRSATVKTVLDRFKDANLSIRCLVTCGGMFVRSLSPSEYYTSFDLLGLKYDSVELELFY